MLWKGEEASGMLSKKIILKNPPRGAPTLFPQLSHLLIHNDFLLQGCWHRSRYNLLVSLISSSSITVLTLNHRCVGVWQNDRVEIIANDQGNRTTPSYVSFSESERLIGDAAKNQVAMNPHNTYVHAVILSLYHLTDISLVSLTRNVSSVASLAMLKCSQI
jgi:hypothetical protein